MTPEELSQLRSKQWLLRAKVIRSNVSKPIADALGKPPAAIAFTNEDDTCRISGVFAAQVQANKDIEFPNRQMAIEFVERELKGISGPAFLLEDEFDDCGAVMLEFSEAVANVDALLQHQHECFRLVSADGNAGACVITQEGSAPQYSRYVTLWSPNKEHNPG